MSTRKIQQPKAARAAFVEVRTRGVTLRAGTRERLEARASEVLGNFESYLSRAVIRLTDVSGPIGAPVAACKITIDLRRREPVVVEGRAKTPRLALSAALVSAERAVRRLVERTSKTRRSRGQEAKLSQR